MPGGKTGCETPTFKPTLQPPPVCNQDIRPESRKCTLKISSYQEGTIPSHSQHSPYKEAKCVQQFSLHLQTHCWSFSLYKPTVAAHWVQAPKLEYIRALLCNQTCCDQDL